MSAYPIKYPKPANHQDFENMCAHVYGIVYKDKMPQKNGRTGQNQGGIDVFVHEDGMHDVGRRIGIQCKAVQKLAFDGESGDTVLKEVEKADKAGQQIKHLIIATTAESDVNLIRQVQLLSDQRLDDVKFTVSIEFWSEIEQHCEKYPQLKDKYTQPSDWVKTLLDQCLEHIKAEDFKKVIEKLDTENPNLGAFNHRQLVLRRLLLAESRLGTDDFNGARQHIEGFDNDSSWLDENGQERLTELQLTLNSSDASNTETFQKELDAALQKHNKNAKIFALKCMIQRPNDSAVATAQLPDFSELTDAFKQSPEVVYEYLMRDISVGNFDTFDKKHNMLSAALKDKTLIKYCYLYKAVIQLQKDQQTANHAQIADTNIKPAIAQFSPRLDKLWLIQTPRILKPVVTQLIVAYTLIDDFENVLRLVNESQERNIELTDVSKIYHLDAMLKQNSPNFNVKWEAYLPTFTGESALRSLADQICFVGRRLDLLEPIKECADRLGFPKLGLQLQLQVCMWELEFAKDKNQSNVIVQSMPTNIVEQLGDDHVSLCQVGQLLEHAGDDRFDDCLKQIIALATDRVKQYAQYRDIVVAAQFFVTVEQQYPLAIEILEQAVSSKQPYSPSHNELLTAYVANQNLPKAKSFLEQCAAFSEDVWQNLNFVNHVFGLINMTHDWAFIGLVLPNLEKAGPSLAMTWLLKLKHSEQTENASNFKQKIRKLPKVLEGNSKAQFDLSQYELKNGFEQNGMRRMYSHVRLNFQDNLAQEDYLRTFMGASTQGDYLDKVLEGSPKTVKEGMAVQIQMSNTEPEWVCIDFEEDEGFDSYNGIFASPRSPLAQSMLGKKVGDSYTQTGPMGIEQTIEILEILDIRGWVYQRFSKNVSSAKTPYQNITSFGGVTADDEGFEDFKRKISLMGKVQRDNLEELMNYYNNSPIMTLGMLARCLGRDVNKLLYSWPADTKSPMMVNHEPWPKLGIACSVQFQDIKTRSVIVDAATWLEFKQCGLFSIFDSLDSIDVSQCSYDLLKAWCTGLTQDNQNEFMTCGVDDQDNFHVLPKNKTQIDKQLQDLKEIIEYIDSKCDVCPAYGAGEMVQEVVHILNALDEHSPEEAHVLRLAIEKDAFVVSMDAKFRAIVEFSKAGTSISPYDFASYLFGQNILSAQDYYLAIARLYVGNRNSLDLPMESIAWAMAQNEGLYKQLLWVMSERLQSINFEDETSAIDFLVTLIQKMSACVFTGKVVSVQDQNEVRMDWHLYFYNAMGKNPKVDEQKLLVALERANGKYFLSRGN